MGFKVQLGRGQSSSIFLNSTPTCFNTVPIRCSKYIPIPTLACTPLRVAFNGPGGIDPNTHASLAFLEPFAGRIRSHLPPRILFRTPYRLNRIVISHRPNHRPWLCSDRPVRWHTPRNAPRDNNGRGVNVRLSSSLCRMNLQALDAVFVCYAVFTGCPVASPPPPRRKYRGVVLVSLTHRRTKLTHTVPPVVQHNSSHDQTEHRT